MDLAILAKEDVLDRVDGDIEFLAELMDGFNQSFPGQMAELMEAADKSDSHQIERKAHALKGALKNLGGLKSGESAYKIERAAKNGEVANIKVMLLELENNVREFQSAFNIFLSEHK